MDGLLKNVKSTIKSLIVSCPNQMTISGLNNDYKNMEGREIPYRQLGFKDLEQFLRAIPDTLAVNGNGRDAVLTAKNSGNVSHIQNMISKQKNCTNRSLRASRSRSSSTAHNQYKYNFNSGPMQSINRQLNYAFSEISKSLSDKRPPYIPNVHQQHAPNTRPLVNSNTRSLVTSNTRPQVTPNPRPLVTPNARPQVTLNARPQVTLNPRPLVTPNLRPQVPQNTRPLVTPNTRPLVTPNTRPLVTPNTRPPVTSNAFNPPLDKNLQRLMSSMDTLNVLSSQMSILQQSNNNILKANTACVNNNKQAIQTSNNWNTKQSSSVANAVPIKPPALISSPKKCNENAKQLDKLDVIYSTKSYNDDESAIPHGILNDKIFRSMDFPKEALPIGTKIKSAAIPEQHYKRGTIFSMVITEIHSPIKFWFHFNDTKKLDDLMERLQSTYNSVASNKYRISYPTPKNYCVAKFKDLWHRAEILKETYKSEVKVFLIDYGTTTFVPLQNIKFLLNQYGDLPAQAHRGALSHIKPTARFWATSSASYLLKLSYLKLMYGQMTEYNIRNSVAYIVICDSNNEKDLQINKCLIQNGYAQFDPDWLSRLTEKEMNTMYDYQFPNFEVLEKGTFPCLEELCWLMRQGISNSHVQQIYQEHQSKLRESPKSLQAFLQQNFIDRLVLIVKNSQSSKDPIMLNDENIRDDNSKLNSTNPFKTIC